MLFDVRELAARKHRETSHPEVEWLRALETARQSLRFVDIGYADLEELAVASRSPGRFTTLVRLIYQYGRRHAGGAPVTETLLRFVDASAYSLSDWVDALDVFHAWLGERGRRIDFEPMLKYLECCLASPDAQAGGQSFAALVEDMLRVHGYEP